MRCKSSLFIIAISILLNSSTHAEQAAVWIGMSAPSHGQREGIYRATLDLQSGDLSQPKLAAEIKNPEFLALRPDGKVLYTACQLADDKPGVAAFEVSDDKQSLRFLNSQPIGDSGACHVATDRTGRCLFSAQYDTGTVAVFPLAADGRIEPRSALVHHIGNGPNKQRQEGPHPHFVGTDPGNRFLFVPDLGSDRVAIYKMDLPTGKLEPHGRGSTPLGSGPRHLVFHPNGRFVFVVNELGISVTAFAYDSQAGTLTPIETVDLLPPGTPVKLLNTAAEINIHPGGEFLYASVRGDDSICALRVDPQTGRLTRIDQEPIRGSHPRSFHLDPTGRWLLVAGRDSNTVSEFRIDPKTGELMYAGKIVNSPTPMCIEIQKMP